MEILGAIGALSLFTIAYKNEEKSNKFISKYSWLNSSLPFLVCLAVSFLFAAKLHLSPFNASSPATDASVFLYIGKAMYNGAVPYVDFFDHKGIILYFIEYLGYAIGFGNEIGVWIIEIINIYLTSLIFFHTAKLFSNSKILCYMSVYIVLVLNTFSFFIVEGGNLTEEYALPWISLSLYFVIKFFKTKEYKNWHIVLIGVSFAVVFFLRVNMVGLWGALLLCVTIHFIKNKQFPDLLKCGLLFVLGVALVCIPIFIYLIATHSLQAMIDYYFIFNFSYTGSASKKGILTFWIYCIDYAKISALFIVFSLLFKRKDKTLWINILTLIFAYFSASISGRSYPHYAIILVPFFIIPTICSVLLIMEKAKEILLPLKMKNKCISVMVITFCFLLSLLSPAFNFYIKLQTPDKSDSLCTYLSENTTEDDDVLVIGNWGSVYVKSNRQTKNKFFYQFLPVDISDDLYREFIGELERNPSDYIAAPKTNTSLFGDEINYTKVIEYLESKCKNGTYHREDYKNFQIYVRN